MMSDVLVEIHFVGSKNGSLHASITGAKKDVCDVPKIDIWDWPQAGRTRTCAVSALQSVSSDAVGRH